MRVLCTPFTDAFTFVSLQPTPLTVVAAHHQTAANDCGFRLPALPSLKGSPYP